MGRKRRKKVGMKCSDKTNSDMVVGRKEMMKYGKKDRNQKPKPAKSPTRGEEKNTLGGRRNEVWHM